MANQEQLEIMMQGVNTWNEWRKENPGIEINLRRAKLAGMNLSGVDLSKARLSEADLSHSNLSHSQFRAARMRATNLAETNLGDSYLSHAYLSEALVFNANLERANLRDATLNNTNLRNTNLCRADLRGCIFQGADISGANLIGADLRGAILVGTKIDKTKASGSFVYGVNVWDLDGDFEEQKDLIITPPGQSIITVDNIRVAQFIYLILKNEEIRDVINTLTSKSVLILGRFALPERKVILDALRNKLREYDLLPIVFDFDRPSDKDFTETIKTLAGISYFVIADVTNPKSSPLELQATVPDYQIPFVPIIQEGESPFAMMVDLQKKYPWVLPTRSYDSIETLMTALKPGIIDPAVEMKNKLRLVKAQEQVTESLKDYLGKTL